MSELLATRYDNVILGLCEKECCILQCTNESILPMCWSMSVLLFLVAVRRTYASLRYD
jgi:hypothetical protein